MKLVVVESPAKVKTISKYLGNKYKVVASMGHVVDLPKNELGVDEKTYKPKYIVTNKKALKNVKDSFKGIKTLIIASDLDREGEAIGWHIAQELGVIDKRGKIKNSSKKLERIIFSSITEEAINEAINNPRNIDFDLVDAQQTRRILDRLFGYKLSPLIWKKIKYGLSAGRVQSVAVRLIVDREDERDKFDPKEYWSIFADLLTKYKQSEITREIVKKKDDKTIKFKGIKFELVKINSKKVEIGNSRNAESIINKLPDKGWIIDDIIKKETKRYPKPPFITSTLQRTAVNLFGFSAKRTMRIAQSLYESGYITYMRTDSFNINKKELSKIRNYIRLNFGENYLSNKEIIYKAKSAQEAHEAIRPTNISRTSDSIHNSTDAKRIYELIRNRTLACQMSNASIENTKVYIRINKYLFQASGIRTLFEGYLKVYKEVVSENLLPKLEKKQELFLNKVIGEQHFTSPPPRYSEATLIKTLEQFGIGRPSTYAPIISTILARKYVIKEGKYFIPTDTGKIVTRLLKKYFSEIVDTGFTAEIEKDFVSLRKWIYELENTIKEMKERKKIND
jgi:DNA topoisomerase-1